MWEQLVFIHPMSWISGLMLKLTSWNQIPQKIPNFFILDFKLRFIYFPLWSASDGDDTVIVGNWNMLDLWNMILSDTFNLIMQPILKLVNIWDDIYGFLFAFAMHKMDYLFMHFPVCVMWWCVQFKLYIFNHIFHWDYNAWSMLPVCSVLKQSRQKDNRISDV